MSNTPQLKDTTTRVLIAMRREAILVRDDATAALDSQAMAGMEVNAIDAELERRGAMISDAQMFAAMYGDGADIAREGGAK